MGLFKSAIGDAFMTSMWVFSLPVTRVITSILAAYLGIQIRSLPGLFASTILATFKLLTFMFIGKIMGGANFNPSTSVSFYAAGLRPDASPISLAVRLPAQAAGAVAGVQAILKLMPENYRDVLRGPSLKVDLHSGAIAEGLLTFLFCFGIHFVMRKGPKSLMVQIWLVSWSTAGLVIAGSGYTGPSMNPANAFGWAYVNNMHNTWQQFYVYWISPCLGAVLAGLVVRVLFDKPVTKQKQS
ncbi:hypothetical protein UlMin_022946 [Ulmus minor]